MVDGSSRGNGVQARDATHEVEARRRAGRAVLRCRACGAEDEVQEGEFDRLNEFVDRHRGCVGVAKAPNPAP